MALMTCTECGASFHGRVDAAYCSPACRSKAYRDRRRIIRDVTDNVTAVDAGPVPDGDEWMTDRFWGEFTGGYLPVTDAIAAIESQWKTAKARSTRIHDAETDGPRRIEDYVNSVIVISRELYDDDDVDRGNPVRDFDTPLGDSLPAGIGVETAAGLARDLRAALPRISELASLLERRAAELDV